jgi:hypothetical protein
MSKRIPLALVWMACMAAQACAQTLDAKAASDKSARLTQQAMDQAWEHFEAATVAFKQGKPREALARLRAGATLHPAELSPHLMAARIAEAEALPGVAAAHWQLVALLASSGSADGDQAEGALKRLTAKLAGERKLQCNVFGLSATAWESQCDEGPVPAAAAAPAGLDYKRVQVYRGPQKPRQNVAVVFAMDASPNWGTTYICKIDGAGLAGGVMASVVYLLPGTYRLGWCYRHQGEQAQGETEIRVRGMSLYQINASRLGEGRYSHSFIEMNSSNLTWRQIAPGKASLPEIDAPVPYGPVH